MKKFLFALFLLGLSFMVYAQEPTNPHAKKETRIRTGRVVWAEVVNKVVPFTLKSIVEKQSNVQLMINHLKTVKCSEIQNPATLSVSMTSLGGRILSSVDYVVEYRGKYYRCVAVASGSNIFDLKINKMVGTNNSNIYTLYFIVPAVDKVEEVLYDLVWTLDEKNATFSSFKIEAKRCDEPTPLETVLEKSDAFKERLVGYKLPPANIRVALPFNTGARGSILSSKNNEVGQGTAVLVTGGVSGNALQLSGGYSTLSTRAFQYGETSKGEQFAFSFWVRPKIFKPGYIFAHGSLTSNGLFFKTTSTGLEVQIAANGDVSSLVAPLKLDQWQLISLSVYKKNIKLYVNDRLVSELTVKNNIGRVDDEAVLGRAINLASDTSFEGWIDELRLYHNQLSLDEVKERVNKKE